MNARSIADLTAGTVLATVDIKAPPERVFRAISSSEITAWWGSDDMYRTTEWVGDLRPGGSFRSSGRGADGSPFAVEGEFLEIDPPRRLVHTWRPDWDGGDSSTVTYTLAAIDGGTRLTIRHEGFGNPASCQGHADGWSRVLSWLDGYASPARKAFLVRLLAPRPTFPFDMTDAERNVMAEHAAYWGGKLAEGTAVAFGPVADPAGPWGLGLVRAAGEEELAAFEQADPAIRANLGFRYQVLPMLQLVGS